MNISVNGISFAYGTHQVLKNIDFTLTPGHLTFLLGPNGSGKSTLFKCMLGHRRPQAGAVSLDGMPTTGMSPAELAHRIAYIPQISTPTFNYTVLQAVLMGRTAHMKLFSTPSAQDIRIAYEALERLGIRHLADKGSNQISGGEQQLVLIARALAQQAQVIIMDEPTSSLDYGNQLMVLSQMKSLCQDGKLVFLSSHNPQHAMAYGDDVLVLYRGKVWRHGTPQEVITREMIHQVYHVDVAILQYTDDAGQVRHMVAPIQGGR
jgi:iron complex transport system ATP-binding protein